MEAQKSVCEKEFFRLLGVRSDEYDYESEHPFSEMLWLASHELELHWEKEYRLHWKTYNSIFRFCKKWNKLNEVLGEKKWIDDAINSHRLIGG